MHIYRLETEAGRGVYRCLDCAELPYDCARHPTPSEDQELAPAWNRLGVAAKTHYYFGFKSLDQLRYWFYKDEWLITAARKGVGLAVWEAPNDCQIVVRNERRVVPGWHAGYTQAVFVKEAAKRVYFNESTLEAVEFLKDYTW